MRILLVKPDPVLGTVRRVHGLILLEPLELGYLAAAVPAGHEVRILDLRLPGGGDRAFLAELRRYRPDVVGISGYTHELERVKKLAGLARAHLPAAKVVVGGHHATVLPQDYNLDCFDAIVRGEGCAPFAAVVESLAAGRDLRGIANVLVPGAGFERHPQADLPRYPDLATIPAPRRDLWDARRYRCVWPSERHADWQSLFPPVALVRSSFGCAMNCSFCVVPRLSGGRHMPRAPEAVAEEIAGLKVGHVYFCDDETFLDPEHAARLARVIESRGIRKRYFAWARSTTVIRSPDLFRTWRGIGLDAVFLGFEAASTDELKAMSKRSTVQDNEQAHQLLREMGIAVQAGFMVQPGYSREDFTRLRSYIKAMPPAQVTLTVFTPSPGSPAWRQQQGSFVCDPYGLHDCMHPLTKTAIGLKEFHRLFSSLVWAGAAKSPLRSRANRIRPWDIARIWLAAASYARALRKAYRDFPRSMW